MEALIVSGGIKRSELASLLRISSATLSAALAPLETLGLLSLGGEVRAGRGRPPERLSARAEDGAPQLVAIRIEPIRSEGSTQGVLMSDSTPGNSIVGARIRTWACTVDGGVVRTYEERSTDSSPDAVVNGVIACAKHAIARVQNATGSEPLAIGIELGGHINAAGIDGQQRGEVIWSPIMQSSAPVPLAARVRRATGVCTVVENDVNALARYEHWLGLATAEPDFVTVMAGLDGIGAALYSNRALGHGANGMAGEIGHNPVATTEEESSLPCWCGKSGCLDAIASGHAIIERIGRRRDGYTNLEGAELVARADPSIRKVLESAGRAIGRTLTILVNTVDPGRVIVSGRVWHSSEILKAAALDAFSESLFRGISRYELIADEGNDRVSAAEAERTWTSLMPSSSHISVVPIFECRRDDSAGAVGTAIAALMEHIAGLAVMNKLAATG